MGKALISKKKLCTRKLSTVKE